LLGNIAQNRHRHEAGERVIKLNFAQIRRLKELLEQAGMSIDDLPGDLE
jgi:hypothetical protein